MRARAILTAAPLLLLALGGCTKGLDTRYPEARSTQSDAAATKAIDDLRARWVEATMSEDPTQVTSLLARDVKLFPADHRAVAGSEEVETFVRASLDEADVSDLRMNPERTVIQDGVATEWGSCSGVLTPVTDGERGEPIKVTNNYMVVMEQQSDGEWKIVRSVAVDTEERQR